MIRRRTGGPASIAGPLLRFGAILAAMLAVGALVHVRPAGAIDWIPPPRLTALLPGATLAPNAPRTLALVLRANGAGGSFNWSASSTGSFIASIAPSSGTVALTANVVTTVTLTVTLPDSAVGTGSLAVDIWEEQTGSRAARVTASLQAATGGRPEVIPLPAVWSAPAGTNGAVGFQVRSTIGSSESILLTTGRFNPDPNNEGGLFAGGPAPSPLTLGGGATITVNVPTTIAARSYAGNVNSVQLSVAGAGGFSSAAGFALTSATLADSLPTALVPRGVTSMDGTAAGRDGPAYLASRSNWLVPAGIDGVRVLRAASTDSIGLIDADANGMDDRIVGTIQIPAFAAALSILPGFVAASGETLDVGLLAAGEAGLMILDLRMVETPPFGTWSDFFDTDGNGIDDRILRTIPTPGFATDVGWARAPNGRVVAFVADADLGSNPVAADYNPALITAGTGAGIVAVDIQAAVDSLGPVPWMAGGVATQGSALDLELRGGGASTEMLIADGSGGVGLYGLTFSFGAPAFVSFTSRGSIALSGMWGSPYARDVAWIPNSGDSAYAAVATMAGGLQIVRAPRGEDPLAVVLAQQTAAPVVGVAGAWTGMMAGAMRSGGVSLFQSPGAGELNKIQLGAPAPYTGPVNLARGQSWATSGVLERAHHQSWVTSATSLRFRDTVGPTPDLMVADGGRLLVLRPGTATVTSVEVEPTVPFAGRWRVRAMPNPASRLVTIEALTPAGWPQEERLSLGVYDVRGRLVRSFPPQRVSGIARLTWDGRDDSGRPVASGRYWARARRAWPFFESSTPITWLR